MVNLDKYIRNEHIKNIFKQSTYIIIKDIDEIDNIVLRISYGDYINIIFESSYLKDRFFYLIQINRPFSTIINCNSNIDIFKDKLFNANDLIIYNIGKNINNGTIDYIYENKGILVC